MSTTTTFDLEVVTSRTPTEFVKALFDLIDVEAKVEFLDGIEEITTPNFLISAFAGAADALSHELEIDATVFIEFRPKPSLDTHILAIRRLLQAMDKWLHSIDNDFVLTYNGETVMMYRKSGTLLINSACAAWTPARLALISFPYEQVEMPALRDTADD